LRLSLFLFPIHNVSSGFRFAQDAVPELFHSMKNLNLIAVKKLSGFFK
jgi:hypothetical protein